jgi:CCR4-NOT transcriptional complex subunit CAF120
MGMMMSGAPSPYGPPGQQQPRPQTPGAMNMLLDGGGTAAPSVYGAPSMIAGINPRSMSPGPGMHFAAQTPAQQARPQMMPHSTSYGGAPPGAGGWNMGAAGMPLRQGPGPGGPMVLPSPSMNMGFGGGMQGQGRPHSPAFQLPPQGQYAPPGTPSGPRPGTPGRMMQFHGQAF